MSTTEPTQGEGRTQSIARSEVARACSAVHICCAAISRITPKGYRGNPERGKLPVVQALHDAVPPAVPAAHPHTQVCSLDAEQRTQRDSAILAALALRKLFHVEGEVLEKVDLFQYLGRIVAQDNDDVRAVGQQIKKAQAIWARVNQVLTAKNTPPKVSAKFYKAVMQSVLLYGSKT